MKNQKNGISLIVLVITIIVIIILAVAVILSIANNNPIENANKAKFQNDLKTIQEELTLKQSSNYIDEHTGKTTNEITIEDLNSAENYVKNNKLIVVNEKLCYVNGGVTDVEKEWAEEVGLECAGTLLKAGEDGLIINSDGLLTTGDNGYEGNETALVIPKGVKEIGSTAFMGCTEITSIVIPNTVTSIKGAAFLGCTSLKTINIPEGVTSIGDSVFSNCTSLKTLTIPSTVTTVGSEAFSESGLKTLIIKGEPRFKKSDIEPVDTGEGINPHWGISTSNVTITGTGYIENE